MGYDDRQPNVVERPWNSISSSSPTAYRFIEIPLRPDITTIVGANESGKSHLLSALSKVIYGIGIPESDDPPSEFNVTDLCHYASVKDKNAKGWPNVGAIFDQVTPSEVSSLVKASGDSSPSGQCTEVALVLAHAPPQEAVLYFGRGEEPVSLSKEQLKEVRDLLPNVEFIRSNMPLASELPIDDLLANANGVKEAYVEFKIAQDAARLVGSLSFGSDKKIDDDSYSAITKLQSRLSTKPEPKKNSLATQLFEDVLGLHGTAIELLSSIKKKDRGFAEGLVATWNNELDRTLNLRRFWQQDGGCPV